MSALISGIRHIIYRLDPKSGNIKVVDDDFVEPNGITFSPDEKKLYVSDTGFTYGLEEPVAYTEICFTIITSFGSPDRAAMPNPAFRANASIVSFDRKTCVACW